MFDIQAPVCQEIFNKIKICRKNENHIVTELRKKTLSRMNKITDDFMEIMNRVNETNYHKCLRPYHVEYTSSRPITEVKQRRARLVLGWVTAWEYRVS